jgi:predicted metal-binding membrane protein
VASLALPSAARRSAWRRPEWPWVAVVVAAWAGLVAWSVAAGGAMEHALAAAGLGWWALMVVAMMIPATVPVARQISFDSMWDRRYRSPLLFLVAFVAVWVAFGAVALGAWQLAATLGAGHAIHGAVATGALLLIAANWQLAPSHRRFLKRCHRTLALGARGRAADRACLRYGVYHARQCTGACWPLMLAMVPGHGLALMVALTGLSSWQRLARRPRRTYCAGALVALAAVVMLAG